MTEYSIIDSFTLFTSSTNKIIKNKLSNISISSLDNINDELVKLRTKVLQQNVKEQIGGNIIMSPKSFSKNSETSSNKYMSDSYTKSNPHKIISSGNYSTGTYSESSSNKSEEKDMVSSTNNFMSMYESDMSQSTANTSTGSYSDSYTSSYSSSRGTYDNTNNMPLNTGTSTYSTYSYQSPEIKIPEKVKKVTKKK